MTLARNPGVRDSSALAIVELGTVGVFAAGVASGVAGDAAPWYALAAVLLGLAIRAVDLESCALFLPGGLYGTAREAFGDRASTLAASTLLVDYAIAGALAASAAGHALTRSDDPSTVVAVCVIGAAWLWLRQGRAVSPPLLARAVWISAGVVVVAIVAGMATVLLSGNGGGDMVASSPV